jgi:hypothetical protein
MILVEVEIDGKTYTTKGGWKYFLGVWLDGKDVRDFDYDSLTVTIKCKDDSEVTLSYYPNV